MSRGDWRSPVAYEMLRSLDAPGFAWEFLRRNQVFMQELRALERAARHGVAMRAEANAFAARWGVRFPVRPREECGCDSLDSTGPADRHRDCGASGKSR